MKQSLKWIFAASIAANIVMAGFLIGQEVPSLRHHHRGLSKEQLSALPAEKRELVESTMKKARERRKEQFKKAESVREEMVAIMSAPQFDEKAFAKKAKELDAFFADAKQQMLSDMVALAKQCNQEERKILAEQFRHPPRHEVKGEEKQGRF